MPILVSVALGVVLFLLLGLLWFAAIKLKNRKDRIADLETRDKNRVKVLEAYRLLDDHFVAAGWKLTRTIDSVGEAMVIHVTRKLVSGGRIYMRFSAGNPNFVMISPELPPSKIPMAYRKKRIEEAVESEFMKASPFKQTYSMAENSTTSFFDVAKQVVEAVEKYEREWSALKGSISQANRLILRAVKAHEDVDERLGQDLEKIMAGIRSVQTIEKSLNDFELSLKND